MAIAGPLEGGMARTRVRTHTQERHPTVGPGTRPLDLVVRVLRVALSRSKRLERASQSGSARPCRCSFANWQIHGLGPGSSNVQVHRAVTLPGPVSHGLSQVHWQVATEHRMPVRHINK